MLLLVDGVNEKMIVIYEPAVNALVVLVKIK